jgi:hypothetical protein
MRMILILAAGAALGACGPGDTAEQPATADAAATESSAQRIAANDGSAAGGVADAGMVPLSIEATVDGRRYTVEGTGECRHAPDASIYGEPSAMWLVQYSGAGEVRSLSLTVWQPKSGAADQVSVTLGMDDASPSISTVRGGEIEGSASAGVEAEGAGARLQVDGRDAAGNALRIEVRCARVGAVEAVGG